MNRKLIAAPQALAGGGKKPGKAAEPGEEAPGEGEGVGEGDPGAGGGAEV